MKTWPTGDKEPGEPGPLWKAFILSFLSGCMSALPCCPPELFGLSLMLSLSFLYLLSLVSPLSQVNLVMDKLEMHILLIWGLNEVGNRKKTVSDLLIPSSVSESLL